MLNANLEYQMQMTVNRTVKIRWIGFEKFSVTECECLTLKKQPEGLSNRRVRRFLATIMM